MFLLFKEPFQGYSLSFYTDYSKALLNALFSMAVKMTLKRADTFTVPRNGAGKCPKGKP